MTPAELDALEALLVNPRVWKAPWVARRFEIDCPCPNGEHCGDTHTCEEVEAPEVYPNGAPGDPADESDGQCVVQISVPGLETFAGPTAAAIAALHNAAPALIAAAREAERYREVLKECARLSSGESARSFEEVCHVARAVYEIARAALEKP